NLGGNWVGLFRGQMLHELSPSELTVHRASIFLQKILGVFAVFVHSVAFAEFRELERVNGVQDHLAGR
ncbi:MAG: hypothetical protein K9M08_18095, partial [Pirellula sp.]|nr:hypothetical protein [Pirellula sp.]